MAIRFIKIAPKEEREKCKTESPSSPIAVPIAAAKSGESNTTKPKKSGSFATTAPAKSPPSIEFRTRAPNKTFDRKAYMREYMRQRRQKENK